MNGESTFKPTRELSFHYENIHFDGRDLNDETQIELDIVGRFYIRVGSAVLYDEEDLPLVELAIALNDWILGDFPTQQDFAHESQEYEETGLITFMAQGNDQWKIGSVRQLYEEGKFFHSTVIERECRKYIESVTNDLQTKFGIVAYPMTSRHVGRAIYVDNLCPHCRGRVGFWISGDGETMVLKCDRCNKVWSEPYQLPSVAVLIPPLIKL